jgi:beta-1,2-mannobiose phosphorylase / 1,2-beta-oligomannan phosphorylase
MAALRKLKTFVKNKKKIRTLGAFSYNGRVYLYFQLSTDLPTQFNVAVSADGFSFGLEKRKLFIKKGVITNEDISLCKDFSISEYAGYFLLIYVRTENKKTILEKAWSKDLISWTYEGNMIPLSKSGIIVSNYTLRTKSFLYSSDKSIFTYFSTDLIHWKKEGKELLTPREKLFDSGKIAIESIINSEKGILLLYHSEVKGIYSVGIALFDRDNPTHLLWRSAEPLWTTPEEWKKKSVHLIGTVLHNGHVLGYWQVENAEIYVAVYAVFKISDGHTSKDISLKLKRPKHNPLITPKSKNSWEAFNTFNPAAVYDDGKVHILYRAQGHDYVSTLGYAASRDGIHIDERLDYPVYTPSRSFEQISDKKGSQISTQYVSGGGYGGCEDPRISRIDDRYYLTYVAFDGCNPPRIALTSISVENFLNKRWLWERPVLISPPGVVDKSAIIFPQKINGKYVIMHRIYPDILVDFIDSLNFDGTSWLKGEYKISPRAKKWDSRKIGAGAPPLKTKYGWLLIYQSVGEQDPGRYKIGAMLLDLKDPTKVLHRSQSPILEPDAIYENDGFKAGVIYPCGAVIIGNTLYVYYGAADSYVCVATANLDEFLNELRHSELARLTTPVMERVF